jgi:hypothetical protein
MKEFDKALIVPCGMNCGICSAYLAYSRNIPRKRGKLSIVLDVVLEINNVHFSKDIAQD